MWETYSLWELGQTPHNEKQQNDTSVDRVTTCSQNRQRKNLFLLVDSLQNQIELQLFSVAIVNGYSLKAKE